MKKLIAVAAFAPLMAHAAGMDLTPKPHFYFSAGGFEPDTGGSFRNRDGGGGWGLGFGRGLAPRLSWEAHFISFGQEVDTPAVFRSGGFLVRTEGRADIETYGFGGQLRLATAFGPLEPYAAFGVGWYRSEMEIRRSSIVTFFALRDASIKRSDSGIGTQLQLGADLRLGKTWSLGYQYRQLNLTAQFGEEIPGPVDVGGKFQFLTSRWVF